MVYLILLAIGGILSLILSELARLRKRILALEIKSYESAHQGQRAAEPKQPPPPTEDTALDFALRAVPESEIPETKEAVDLSITSADIDALEPEPQPAAAVARSRVQLPVTKRSEPANQAQGTAENEPPAGTTEDTALDFALRAIPESEIPETKEAVDLSITSADIDALEPEPQPVSWPRHPAKYPPAPITGNIFTARITAFFTTGNVVTKIGVIVLFFGVAFLLKYAAQRNMFPIELRFLSVALAGLAVFSAGLYLRKREHMYGLLLQGCGIGTLYLTIFAATKYYTMLPYQVAYPAILLLVVATGILSVWQDARYLAVLAIAGGFLAPVLMATSGGSHVFLFSYYALLNVGITGIAWYRSWRELNLLGFFFTFIIASLWGFNSYQPKYFTTTEPFLILFFLFYVIISILFAFRQPSNQRGLVDGSLVFGVPFLGFSLQYLLVVDIKYGLAISAAVVGLFYALVAYLLWLRRLPEMKILREAFTGLAFVFLTLAIPLALDGWWTSAVWAIEGCAVLWLGVRQNQTLPRLSGIALQIAAGASFLFDAPAVTIEIPVVNGSYLGCLLICLAGFLSSYFLNKYRNRLSSLEDYAIVPLLIWGLAWWFGSALQEIDRFVLPQNSAIAIILQLGLSYAIMQTLALALRWSQLQSALSFVLPLVSVFAGLRFALHHQFMAADMALVNQFFIGGLLISCAGFFSSYYHTFISSLKHPLENMAAWAMLVWGVCWWYTIGFKEIDSFLASADQIAAILVLIALSTMLFSVMSQLLNWNRLSHTALLLLPSMVFLCLLVVSGSAIAHLFSGYTGFAWLLSFIVFYRTLYNGEKVWPTTMTPWYHLAGWLLLLFLCTWEFVYWLERLAVEPTWVYCAWALIPTLSAVFMLKYGPLLRWPVKQFHWVYRQVGLAITIMYLVGWVISMVPYHGDPKPLPYIPLLNPLELLQLCIVILLVSWAKNQQEWLSELQIDIHNRALHIVACCAAFLLFNVMVARTVHFWAAVPFSRSGLYDSVIFQATLAIIWGIMAVIITFFAAKNGSRAVWVAGASILTLVVAKLFMIDLSGSGTVARIVSFIGVGGFMLLIGYLSPLPPAKDQP